MLHRLAMSANIFAEPLMRRYPDLKQSIVRAYKAVNQAREGYDPMDSAVRAQLIQFYAPGIRMLQNQLGVALPDTWRYLATGAASE